jgi:hypothetical protein
VDEGANGTSASYCIANDSQYSRETLVHVIETIEKKNQKVFKDSKVSQFLKGDT